MLSVLAVVLVYYFASRSVPDYTQSYTVQNRIQGIEIVRDNKAVPHIFAQNDADVFFGLGFAHAQDRLWQMTLRRRTAQGRLSEIFGAETEEVDAFMRRLDIYALARVSASDQPPEARSALQAYADGVNAWIKTVQGNALGRGAPEFFLFQPSIAPWTPADSIALLKLMAVESSKHLQTDILRARTSITIGAELLHDIMPEDPSEGKTSLPEYAQMFHVPRTQIAALPERHDLHPVKPLGFAGASNVWAAQGIRTAGKASLLAVDPHNALSAPSQWMLARLELQSGGVIGATIPGIPVIMAGRSDKLAWGMAASHLDDLDLYVEQLDPQDPTSYKTSTGFKKFKTRQVILKIKDQKSKTLDLRWSDNGPVLPRSSFGLEEITPRDHVVSLRSTALGHQDKSLAALIALMMAPNAKEARNLFVDYEAPSLNLVVADSDTVALQLIGKVPSRRLGHIGQGRIPSQGWLQRNQWKGYFPFEQNPFDLNPNSGIVANTNNKITEAAFPHHISHSWGDSYRFQRLSKLLTERKIHTRDSFMDAQLDTISFSARALLALVAKELWFKEAPAPVGTPAYHRKTALELLANWNGRMNEHDPEPLIYASWMRHFQNYLMRDELGKLTSEFAQVNPVFIERVMRDIDGASVWCDIRQSSRVETCTEIAQSALDAALLELITDYGDRIESWRWGQAHQARHDHPILGHIPLLAWVTNIHQDTSGGDHTLMRGLTKNIGDAPYTNINAAGFRALIDFADLESSLYVVSTGQSGHPLSRHYDDLAQLWRRGEYIPMSLDPDLARAGAVGITTVMPKAN
ncbi:penicillin acylase [Amylibacter marinus]|uniref:Penicillin acylase n=2 Tax=Amylibacter marinus TaxID=1475483 RepID=A0ABQ5VT11_9RHOB|nr:penicillin acylase [Amylibacter marinus]